MAGVSTNSPPLYTLLQTCYTPHITLCYVNINHIGKFRMVVLEDDLRSAAAQQVPPHAAILDEIVATLTARGLQLPALLVLRAGHPLTFLLGQLLWVAQPALSPLISPSTIREAAQLLEEPEAVATLASRLEENEG